MHAKNLHIEHIKCANFQSQCSFPQIFSFLSVFLSFCLSFFLFVCLFSSFSFALFIFLFKYYSVSHLLINQLCCGVVWCGVLRFNLLFVHSCISIISTAITLVCCCCCICCSYSSSSSSSSRRAIHVSLQGS